MINSPVNVHPSSVIINFSEAVSGVDNSDFTLLRTNEDGTVDKIDLSSTLTYPLFQLTASQYELNLLALPLVPGTYRLSINPLNSGITDTAGNAFLTSFATSWVLDIAQPLADIVDVAPDPRQTPVDALNTIFTEKVNGVLTDASQYVLSFDDGTAATAGLITDATNAGPIVVTSAGHGLADGDRITIYGVQGNTNANGVFTVQNATANTFELTGSFGSGIYSSGGRWVRTVSLAGLTVLKETDTRYVLNLSTVTLNQGTYIVSLLANSGITDDAGNDVGPAADQFNVTAQDIWSNGPDAAPTGTITSITTPRGTNAGIVSVTFSEPLAKINGNSSVDYKDFKLTRTVGAITTTVSLINVPITQTGPTTYTLDLTGAGLTDLDGSYILQLLNSYIASPDTASPLKDLTGNALSDDSDPLTATGIASEIRWTKDASLSGPQVVSFLDVQRNNVLGSITKLREVQTLEINFTDDVAGIDLTDASKNFLLTRQATGGVAIPVSLDGIAVQQVTAKQYRINLSTLTGTDGTYRFTVLANGLIKNATTLVDLKNPQSKSWTKDGTLRPTTVGDSTDSNQGNEVVGSGSNYSLRQAIQEANALAGDDVIQLGAGTYTLSLFGVQEDFAASGDLDIRDNLVIKGGLGGTTIIELAALPAGTTGTALNRDRLFQILSGVTVTFQGVTLQKGAVFGSEDGGAIRNSGNLTILDSVIQNSTSQDDAGAINNTGTLSINRTTISGNTAVATSGAIRNAGTLTINNSTLSGNRTTGSNGHGGALMNVTTFSATLENVTISGNTAVNAAGGGIRNDGNLRLINDTIAFNQSLSAGAGLSRNLGTVTIGNTIVSNNTRTTTAADDVAGTFVSLGGNIVRTLGTAVGFNVALGDQTGLAADPNLQPLGFNGGPTQTHALPAFDSTGVVNPAIDRGLIANVTNQDVNASQDQRGALRFLDGPQLNANSVDVGAFEFGTFFVNTTDDSPDVSALRGVADGLAEDGLRQTSLRAAIMESNLLAGESAIMLDGKTYSLKRLAPDITAPTVASIVGVPTAPITTGGVGVVTITFSERVAGFDLAHITLLRNGVAVALPAATFQLTKVSDLVYKIENKADIAAGITNTGLLSVTQTNGQYTLSISPTANVLVNGVSTPTNIRDIENNLLDVTNANVNWVRGIDTFAPSVNITPATITNQFIQNAGTVTLTFSEKVTGVSANNFTLTRNGTAVTGLVVTPAADPNFGGRTVVTLNLQTLTAANGNYVLTFNPTVGANLTIKDSANNSLPAGIVTRAWSKVEAVRLADVLSTPLDQDVQVGEVTKVRLQFTERVAGVKLEDFTMTFDDGSGVGPQLVDLSKATLANFGTVTAVPGFGNASEQWELTFANKQAARDGVYVLTFNGLTNGNQLVTTATTATVTVPFPAAASTTTATFTIGEDLSNIGDLDVVVGAGRVQIFGKGKDASTTVLGNAQPATLIDGNLSDRIFDLTIGSNVAISGVEMFNGKVVYERSGGAFRNFGTLTLNDDDLLTNVADGNGGAVYNAAPFGLQVAITGTQQGSPVLQVAVDNVVNTLTLNSLEAFPSNLPFVLQLESEQMLVTAVNAANNQLTVTRGFNGTTAAAHAANAVVTQLATAGNLSAAVTTSDLTLTVSDLTAFPANAPFTILVDSEQMQVTAVNATTNQLTVTRGFNATVAAVHATNAVITPLSPTAGLASAISNVATTLILDSLTAYPINAPFTILVGTEQMQVIAVNSFINQFTGVRGMAAAQAQGTGVNLLISDAVSATSSTLSLTSIAAFPNGTPFVILVDSEQMRVTGINAATNQFIVDRGYNGTTPVSHAANATITLLPSTTFNRSNFANNTAGSAASSSQFGKGGAIFNETGAITINEGTYTANSAVTDGGAIYNGNQATASLLSTTFTSNLAGRDGGAIYNNDTAILTISSSTLSSNRADATVNGVASDTNGDGGAIYNETSAKLILDDSLLQNNSARNGGALYNDDGTLVLNRDTFGVNSALENGGAIVNTSGGSLTLNQGLFTTNSASDDGGAIQNFGSLVVLDVAGAGTQFLSNEAGTDVGSSANNNGDGGAIFNRDGTVEIHSATFTLNRSHGDAGVIFNDGDGTLTIQRSTFDRNSADGQGGALVNNDVAQTTIDETTFSNNTAAGDGGAIYNNSEFTSGSVLSLTMDDTTLNNNSAARGGAIFNSSAGGMTLTNSTLSANVASVNGGGIANFGTVSLLSDTLYLNDAPIGAGIANNIDGIPPFGSATLKNTLVAGASGLHADVEGDNFVDGGHNLIGNIGAVTTFGIVAVPSNGNLVGDSTTPLNPQLDILRDNGGPTRTHALLFGSPARDAGDNFAVTLNDQRGLNRVFDGDGNGVATVDIGSFESGFVVNSFLDTVDQNPGDGINADANGQSTLRAAIMEANARPGEDTIILGPGIFLLTLPGRNEDSRTDPSTGNIVSTSETGDLDILDDLNIIGAGTDLTFIDAATLDRIFQVFAANPLHSNTGVRLKLSNLTLQNGNATSTDFGGAILNQGTTVLDNVLVINSSAGRGGGIYNDTTGTLTIEDSLFRGNQAAQQGGALYNDGDLTLTRSDIGAVSRLAAAVSLVTNNLASALTSGTTTFTLTSGSSLPAVQ
ncbi:MAG: Cadherin domain-containing protein, partial [Planctomycetota bacterium]